MRKSLLAFSIACLLGFPPSSFANSLEYSPPLALAKTYADHHAIDDYWVSEKMDGARAFWNGSQLLSRSGKVFHAPQWFTRGFPSEALDGELWMGRGSFEQLMQTIRDKKPDEEAWRQVRYWVFDLPEATGAFDTRLTALQQLLEPVQSPYLRVVRHSRLDSADALAAALQEVVDAGGEGLMLQKANATYRAGRHAGLLKLKPFQDDEAVVVAYTSGRGKYTGMVGALLVEDQSGRQFRLGSGLRDEQRKSPPSVGTVVSYRYQGRTSKGIPRFARFLRVRPAE